MVVRPAGRTYVEVEVLYTFGHEPKIKLHLPHAALIAGLGQRLGADAALVSTPSVIT